VYIFRMVSNFVLGPKIEKTRTGCKAIIHGLGNFVKFNRFSSNFKCR